MKPWKQYVASAGLGLALIGGAATAVGAQSIRTTVSHATYQQESTTNCVSEPPVVPGALDRGSDLLSSAKISLDQAIAAAQGAATGDLGEVDLEKLNGTLTFTVEIGTQDVHIDATTGAVIDIVSEETDTGEDDNGADNEQDIAPGTIDRGADLLPQATTTLDQAIATAQRSATGDLGEVDLEMINGSLVFTVGIGDQDVRIDAATGALIEVVSGDTDTHQDEQGDTEEASDNGDEENGNADSEDANDNGDEENGTADSEDADDDGDEENDNADSEDANDNEDGDSNTNDGDNADCESSPVATPAN